jgi:hypothetical protein
MLQQEASDALFDFRHCYVHIILGCSVEAAVQQDGQLSVMISTAAHHAVSTN